MNLVGIVSWYDELAEWLSASITSIVQHCGVTHIVAVDGAYHAFPEGIARPRSGGEQYAAIIETCNALGVGCTIYSPNEAWAGGEVEKRSYGFRLAEGVAEAGVDWYMVMDADQVVTSCGDLKNELEMSHLDVGQVMFWERNGLQDPTWAPVRCLFRALPGLEVRMNHYTYVTQDGRRLWGDEPGLAPPVLTSVEIEHRTWLRPRARKLRQEAYYERRNRLGLERATTSVEVS